MTLKITPALMAKDYARYLELNDEMRRFRDMMCWNAADECWQQLEDLKRKYDGHVPQPPPLTEAK